MSAAPSANPLVAPPPLLGNTPFSDWYVQHKKEFKVLLPPGKYYVGNLLNKMNTELYYNLFGNGGYKSGVYCERLTHRIFLVHIGKGGGDGKKYPVQPQVFGVCDSKDVSRPDPNNIYEFKDYFHCRLFNDRFFFTTGVRPLFILEADSD